MAGQRSRVALTASCSAPHDYHHETWRRRSLIDWSDGALDKKKHGKVGIEFLAEVGRHGDARAQSAVRDRILKHGAKAGRACWQTWIAAHERWELIHKHANRRHRRWIGQANRGFVEAVPWIESIARFHAP